MAQPVNLSSSIATGLRQRCNHRLEHRRDMLNAKEVDFLHSMFARLAHAYTLSEKQFDWLMAVLERTEKSK